MRELETRKGEYPMTTQGYDAKLESLRQAIGEAAIAGEDIGALAAEYVDVQATRQKTFAAENAAAINAEKSSLMAQITALVEASPLATLMGETVNALAWRLTEKPGEEPTVQILVNPKRGRAPGTTTTPAGGSRSKVSVKVGGETMDARAFCDAYANDEERKHSHFTKWPTRLAESIAARLVTEGTPAEVVRA